MFAFAAVLILPFASVDLPACVSYVNMPNGDLPGMPSITPSAVECAQKCVANKACALYTWVGPESQRAKRCSAGKNNGCCWLKSSEVGGKAPVVWDKYACSGYVRAPAASEGAQPNPQPEGAQPNPQPKPILNNKTRNVLYIVIDDLRNELEAYGQNFTWNPHIKKLSDTGTTFDNAYCQIAVCSPSRLSFLTGRRPDHAGMYNFINHFRQADCGRSEADVAYSAPDIAPPIDTGKAGGGCQWGGEAPCGGSGQCCSLCTEHANCSHWTYAAPVCHLKGGRGKRVAHPGWVSGVAGTFDTHHKWTSFPQTFRQNGYLALHTGKIFHTEEGGVANTDPRLNGPGMPPNSDPPSWSPGLFMPQVNAVANMFGIGKGEVDGVPADRAGIMDDTNPDTMPDHHQLADRVISSDAVVKLRFAAYNRAVTGQPFFMAMGFRKPHLAFRFPAPWLDVLAPQNQTKIAEHPTLAANVPAIAHCATPPQRNPYQPPPHSTAQQWRQHYYAAIAWVDSQVGRVLDELDALGLADDTLVVLHADHGWSLGEHGEWQKFSNFEHGTRVPLIIRAPWLPQSAGARSSELAELIDVFPTVADLMGVPLPAGESLDGTSLAPVLTQGPGHKPAIKPWALSQFMRCPSDPKELWNGKTCLFVDRAAIRYMGYTLRVPGWRFTEWRRWNGTALYPDMSDDAVIGIELYSHPLHTGLEYSFDLSENSNEASQNPAVVGHLRSLLHEVVRNQTRVWN